MVTTLMLASDPIVRGTQVLDIFKKRCLCERESAAMVLLSKNLILHQMACSSQVSTSKTAEWLNDSTLTLHFAALSFLALRNMSEQIGDADCYQNIFIIGE